MLATQTYNFLFIMKLQPQLQFYLKTQRNKYRKKWLHTGHTTSDYSHQNDEG